MRKKRTWVYHKTERPKVVDMEDAPGYYKKGWADTPAAFTDVKSMGVDKKDTLAVQGVGESIQGVKEMLNGMLNLDIMAKPGLLEYAKKHLDLTFNKKASLSHIRKRIKERLCNIADQDIATASVENLVNFAKVCYNVDLDILEGRENLLNKVRNLINTDKTLE